MELGSSISIVIMFRFQNLADYFVSNPSSIFYVGQTVLAKVRSVYLIPIVNESLCRNFHKIAIHIFESIVIKVISSKMMRIATIMEWRQRNEE